MRNRVKRDYNLVSDYLVGRPAFPSAMISQKRKRERERERERVDMVCGASLELKTFV